MMYRITKEVSFCAGHRLVGHPGGCARPHGHNYKVQVTVQSHKLNELGMVMDFSTLKQLMNTHIVERFDHQYVSSFEDDIAAAGAVLVDYNPTAENMAADFAHRIMKELPEEVFLSSVRVWETDTSYCEVVL